MQRLEDVKAIYLAFQRSNLIELYSKDVRLFDLGLMPLSSHCIDHILSRDILEGFGGIQCI